MPFISWMLQVGVIDSAKTYTFSFHPLEVDESAQFYLYEVTLQGPFLMQFP